jgi:XrtJ-associated TM-motif-TM protein
MNKSILALSVFVLTLSVSLPLNAQTGCTDSPENPTVVLALVGSVGALLSLARARLRSK